MANQKRGGVVYIKKNGVQQDVIGAVKVQPDFFKKTALKGEARTLGHTAEFMTPYVEGEISVDENFDVQALLDGEAESITVEFYSGKVFVLRDAVYAGDGTYESKEGKIPVRWEGQTGEFI